MAATTISFGNNSNTVPVTNTGKTSSNTDTWKKVAIGGISAIAFGGAAYAATSLINSDEPDVVDENVANDDTTTTTTDTATDNTDVVSAPYHPSLQMATSVNDDMTFAEAFKAARAEVHAGGVFEWHGQVYGTYYGDEWDALSPADQSAFTASTSKVAAEHTAAAKTEQEEHTAQHHEEHHEDNHEVAQSKPDTKADEETESEVIIERIDYDPENEASLAYVTVDGTEVIMADIDNDGVFDVLYVDENGNGEVEENEVYNITDENITVEGLGGYTEPSLEGFIDEDFLANNDTDIDSIEL